MPNINPITLNRLLRFKMFKQKEHQSQCVADVEYDPLTQDLIVEFVERGTYKYHEVPIDTYVDFETAGSQGTYFNNYIRNAYSYERIG
jgi:hypothetical protein